MQHLPEERSLIFLKSLKLNTLIAIVFLDTEMLQLIKLHRLNLYNFEFICPSWLKEGRFDLIVLGFARSRGWTCSHEKSKTNDIANYSSIPFSYSWARHYSLLCLPECLALLLRSIDHKNIRHLYPVSSIHTKTRTILLNHFRY